MFTTGHTPRSICLILSIVCLRLQFLVAVVLWPYSALIWLQTFLGAPSSFLRFFAIHWSLYGLIFACTISCTSFFVYRGSFFILFFISSAPMPALTIRFSASSRHRSPLFSDFFYFFNPLASRLNSPFLSVSLLGFMYPCNGKQTDLIAPSLV